MPGESLGRLGKQSQLWPCPPSEGQPLERRAQTLGRLREEPWLWLSPIEKGQHVEWGCRLWAFPRTRKLPSVTR